MVTRIHVFFICYFHAMWSKCILDYFNLGILILFQVAYSSYARYKEHKTNQILVIMAKNFNIIWGVISYLLLAAIFLSSELLYGKCSVSFISHPRISFLDARELTVLNQLYVDPMHAQNVILGH